MDELEPISADALGDTHSWTNILPPMVVTGTLLLTSCSQAEQVATTLPVFTSTPDTVTATAKPTDIPVTPSETPDPNMPPGATGKDADGNYTRTLLAENGKPVTETWRTIPTGDNGETMTGWFADHIM